MVRSYQRARIASLAGALTLALGLVATLAPPARAAFPGGVPDRARLSLGGLFAGLTTSAQLSLQGGTLGTTLDGERDLGLKPHQSVLRLEGRLRMAGPLSLDAGWVRFDRKADRVLSAPIAFGELTFSAGSQVSSRLDTDLPYAALRVDLVHTPLVRAGPSLGASIVTLNTTMSANAGVLVAGNTIPASGARSYKQTAPVPLVGLAGEVSPVARLECGGYGRWFDLRFDQFSGSMTEWGIRAGYFPLARVGVGVGYEYTRVQVRKLVIDPVDASLDYTVRGLRLSGEFAF
jgi:hypothetical protein